MSLISSTSQPQALVAHCPSSSFVFSADFYSLLSLFSLLYHITIDEVADAENLYLMIHLHPQISAIWFQFSNALIIHVRMLLWENVVLLNSLTFITQHNSFANFQSVVHS